MELNDTEKSNLQKIFDRITNEYKQGNLPLVVLMVNLESEKMGYIMIDGVSEKAADAALLAFTENYE